MPKNSYMEKNSFYVVLESSLLEDKNINSTAKILYATICYYANNEKGYCFVTNRQLMNILGISERQFYRHIKVLTDLKYIIVKNEKNRCYIMPTVNRFYLLAKERREERMKKLAENQIFDYDWLNERD